MTQIRKFSLVYDPGEDRLAWDAEDQAGATTRLWLTQRLCRGLAGAILAMMQNRAGETPPDRRATLQSWEQAAAMADFGKVEGVQPSVEGASGLVTAAHIRPTARGLDLTFDFGAGETRTVSIGSAGVRQTLAVMHRLHVAAGWPLDVWPAWVADPAAAAPTDSVN